jgi:hypothetical protein
VFTGFGWRLGAESNRCTRSCSPLHDHSATEPYRGIGAGNRVRTGDLNLGKVALYQLSYSRTLMRVSTAVVAGTGEAASPASTMARLRSTN